MAWRYESEDIPFEDLLQDGQLAVLEAIARYDLGVGARLSTYAKPLIAGAFEKRRGEAAREGVNRDRGRTPFDGDLQVDKKRPGIGCADDEGAEPDDEEANSTEPGDDSELGISEDDCGEEPIGGGWTDQRAAVARGPATQEQRFADVRRQLTKELQPEKIDDAAWSWLASAGLLERAQAGTVSTGYLAQQHETLRRSRTVFAHLPDERAVALAHIVAHAVTSGSVVERALRAEQVKLLRRWPGILKGELDYASSAAWRRQLNREIAEHIRAAQPHLQPHVVHDDPAYRAALQADLKDIDRLSERAVAEMQSSPLGCARLRAFRKRTLGDQLIARHEVGRWVEGQADREGPPAQAYVRVPIGDDQADVSADEAPPGLEQRLARGRWLERELRRIRDDDAPLPPPEPAQTLSYAEAKTIKIRPDGPLAQLKSLAESLCDRHGWREDEAVSFVLSGNWPVFELRGVTQRSGVYAAASKIVLEVDPRSDANDVLRLYQRRREALGVARDGLPMDERSLKLAVFAEAKWQPGLSWSELREKWKVEHPEDEARLDLDDKHAKKFARECRRAWSRVTGEDWPRPSDWARRVPEGMRENASWRNAYLLEELTKERRRRAGTS
jgi:hypothetical protein